LTGLNWWPAGWTISCKRLKQHSAATVDAEPALACPVESRLSFCGSGNKNVRTNRTYTYWRSARPIPGGVAFENFEMQERFHDGQTFIFGITRRTPQELGFIQRIH